MWLYVFVLNFRKNLPLRVTVRATDIISDVAGVFVALRDCIIHAIMAKSSVYCLKNKSVYCLKNKSKGWFLEKCLVSGDSILVD